MQWAPAKAGVQVMAGTYGDTGRLPLSVEEKKTQEQGERKGESVSGRDRERTVHFLQQKIILCPNIYNSRVITTAIIVIIMVSLGLP